MSSTQDLWKNLFKELAQDLMARPTPYLQKTYLKNFDILDRTLVL